MMDRIAGPVPLDRELMAKLMDAVRHLVLQLHRILTDRICEFPGPALEVRHAGCRSIMLAAGAIGSSIRRMPR